MPESLAVNFEALEQTHFERGSGNLDLNTLDVGSVFSSVNCETVESSAVFPGQILLFCSILHLKILFETALCAV